VGDAGRDLFIQVLRKLVPIAESYDDEGGKAAVLASDIVNMLVDEERSLRFRDAVLELIQRLTNQTLIDERGLLSMEYGGSLNRWIQQSREIVISYMKKRALRWKQRESL